MANILPLNQEDDDEVTDEDYKAVAAPRFQIGATNTQEIDQPLDAAIPPRNIFSWVWSLFNWFTSRNEKDCGRHFCAEDFEERSY